MTVTSTLLSWRHHATVGGVGGVDLQLRAKHPAVAISFSTNVEEKPEDQEPSTQPTSSRKTPPAKHGRSAKPPAKKKTPLTSGKFNNYYLIVTIINGYSF